MQKFIGCAGNGKSTISMMKDLKAMMEAEKTPGPMQVRKCGSTWVCCNGDCGNCIVPRMTTSNKTEPTPAHTYSTSTKKEI